MPAASALAHIYRIVDLALDLGKTCESRRARSQRKDAPRKFTTHETEMAAPLLAALLSIGSTVDDLGFFGTICSNEDDFKSTRMYFARCEGVSMDGCAVEKDTCRLAWDTDADTCSVRTRPLRLRVPVPVRTVLHHPSRRSGGAP